MPTPIVALLAGVLWIFFRVALPDHIRDRRRERGEPVEPKDNFLACRVLASVFGPLSLGLFLGCYIKLGESSSPIPATALLSSLLPVAGFWLVFRWLIPSFTSRPERKRIVVSRLYGSSGFVSFGALLAQQSGGMMTSEAVIPEETIRGPTPLAVLATCVALWALCRWVLPRPVLAKVRGQQPEEAGPMLGALASLGALAMVFGAAAVGLAVVYGGMFLLRAGSTDSVAAAESLLMRLGWCSTTMKGLGNVWVQLAGVVAVIFAGVYFYRLGKARASAEMSRRAEEDARLKHGLGEGSLAALPPSPEMEAQNAEAARLVSARAQLVADGASEKNIAKLDAKLRSIKGELDRLDLERRRKPRPAACGVRLVAPDTFWGRVGTFFISPGLEGLMGHGTKAVAAAVIVAVMAGAVGFPAGSVTPGLAERTAHTQLALDRMVFGGIASAAVNYEEALAALPPSEPLSAEEEAEAEALADEIGSAYEQRLAAHYGGGGAPAPEFKNEFKARAEAVRGQVMENFAKRQGVTTHAKSSFQSSSDNVAKAVRESVRPDKMKAKPVTGTGRDAAKHTAEVMKKGGRGTFQNTKSWWASFKMPTRPGTVGHAFASAFAASVLDSAEVTDTRFQKPPDAELRQAMARGNEARAKQFAADIARGHYASAMATAIPADPAKDSFHPPADMQSIRSRVAPVAEAEFRPQGADLAERFGMAKGGSHTPGSLATDLEPHVKMNAAANHSVERYVRGGEVMSDAHASYGDHFAGNPSDPTNSPRGRLLSDLSDSTKLSLKSAEISPRLGLPPGVNIPPRPIELPSRMNLASNATRARSFFKLRGFARVGGVLIGREPSPPLFREKEISPLASFHWKITDDKKVILTATDTVGKPMAHCPAEALDADAVYAALVYAADGRPTAVTMVEADPLQELKILVHPALVDTRVGQAIIDLDRFVDTFAGTPRGEQKDDEGMDRMIATARIQNAHTLYQVAWAARMEALSPYERGLSGLKDELEAAHAAIGQVRRVAGLDGASGPQDTEAPPKLARSFPVWKDDLIKVLGASVEPTDPLAGLRPKASLTPLREKEEFYDQSLIAVMAGQLGAAESLQAFHDAVKAHYAAKWKPPSPPATASSSGQQPRPTTPFRFRSPAIPARGPMPEDMDEWAPSVLALPPVFQVWSGVRERSFTRDGTLFSLENLPSFPAPGLGGSSSKFRSNPREFGPLEFMLQTAFTSPPQFGEAAKEGEDYSDPSPWEFPALKNWIAERVKAGVAGDPKSQEILRLSKDFTLAQRFFRLVLAGDYGEAFPLHELPALSRALEPHLSPPQRTPRWNSIRGQLEATLAAVLDGYYKTPESKGGWFDSALVGMRSFVTENVKAEETFRRACLELLAAPNRDTAEWGERWTRIWELGEARQQTWEENLAKKAFEVQKLAITLATDPEKARMPSLDAPSGRAGREMRDLYKKLNLPAQSEMTEESLLKIRQTCSLVDHYATAIQIRRSLGVAVDDEQKLRGYSREDAAQSLASFDK